MMKINVVQCNTMKMNVNNNVDCFQMNNHKNQFFLKKLFDLATLKWYWCYVLLQILSHYPDFSLWKSTEKTHIDQAVIYTKMHHTRTR